MKNRLENLLSNLYEDDFVLQEAVVPAPPNDTSFDKTTLVDYDSNYQNDKEIEQARQNLQISVIKCSQYYVQNIKPKWDMLSDDDKQKIANWMTGLNRLAMYINPNIKK